MSLCPYVFKTKNMSLCPYVLKTKNMSLCSYVFKTCPHVQHSDLVI